MKELFSEQTHEPLFQKLMHKYREITIENTLKLLIRCKLAFQSRAALFDILRQLLTYEVHALQFKEMVGNHIIYKVSQ